MAAPAGSTVEYHDLPRTYRTIAGRSIPFDTEGFLWEFSDWDEQVVEALALESGLEALRETHWQVLRFFRDYYAWNRRAPLNRQLKEGTGLSLMALEGLFPGGIKGGARRLAGLPNPKACS
jgi:dissimilatory sulfite reductase related protein